MSTGDVAVTVDVRDTASVGHRVGPVRVNGARGQSWRETPKCNHNNNKSISVAPWLQVTLFKGVT